MFCNAFYKQTKLKGVGAGRRNSLTTLGANPRPTSEMYKEQKQNGILRPA